MSEVGGSIQSVAIRGRLLPVAADADANLMLGGKKIEVKPFGNGKARIIGEQVIGQLTGIKVGIDHDRGDMQFLKEVADGMEFVPCEITLASGHVYQGNAIVAGEFPLSTMDTTAEIALHAEGAFSLQ
jgi:hypothetical protein